MKKIILSIVFYVSCVFAEDVGWTLKGLYFPADSQMQILKVYRLRSGSEKPTYLDGKVKNWISKPFILLDYKVSSSAQHGTLCFDLKDKDNKFFTLCVDCVSGALLMSSRKRKIDLHDYDGQIDYNKYYARAWILADTKTVSTNIYMFHDEQSAHFDIIIAHDQQQGLAVKIDETMDNIKE